MNGMRSRLGDEPEAGRGCDKQEIDIWSVLFIFVGKFFINQMSSIIKIK